nr:N-terminal EF-hand calcium-binding protein 1 isoform X2 [Caretta caretta]
MEDGQEMSPSSTNSSEGLSPALPLTKGMSIFLDILRRADKNDDGKLSFEEFKAYFADGVLSGDELHELFNTIDTHNTDNLDTEELCEYFSRHLGEYENVLSALEDLNVSILKAMDKTKKDYQKASNLEQFVTRFLLKETLNQLQSLQNSLDCAMETTEEQTRQERQGPAKPEVLSIQWPGKRSNRRFQRTNSLSPNSPHLNTGFLEEDNQWMTQINRLQKLIDKLEKKNLKLEPLEEEVLEGNTKSQSLNAQEIITRPKRAFWEEGVSPNWEDMRKYPLFRDNKEIVNHKNKETKNISRNEHKLQHIMIVQRQMSVLEEELEEFRLALKQYVESASTRTGCLHVSIQKLSSECRFIIYEFWENSSAWNSHLQMNYSKTFQRSNVDFLETPELMTTMQVPASWWVLNNN